MARGKKLPGTPAGYGAQSVQVARSDQYGEGAATARSLAAVPLPKMGPDPAAAGAPAGPAMMPGAVPLDAPSSRPYEPITEGATFGPGSSLGELGLQRPPSEPTIDPKIFSHYLPQLEAVASMPDSSPSLRAWVRRVRAQMPPDFDLAAEAGEA